MNSNRGDVWLVDLGSVAKVRPCLVISIPALDRDFHSERLRQRALTTLIPHTTSSRGSRFEVDIAVKFLRAGAFDGHVGLAKCGYVLFYSNLERIDRSWAMSCLTR